jgi:diguanylate cyclase (GGDEF)-like protein
MKTVRSRMSLGKFGIGLYGEIAAASLVPMAALAVWLAREPQSKSGVVGLVALAGLATAGFVLLVVARHAHRVLRELTSLQATMRDLARAKFPARNCAPSRDEFGRPARLLNRLAQNLALRHSLDEVLAQVDEAMLIKPDRRALVRGALQCLSFVTKAELTVFAYFESQFEPTLTVYLTKKGGRSRLENLRLELDADLALQLNTETQYATRGQAPFPQEFARRLYKECGTQDFFVLPIARGGRPWGFLISGHRAPTTFARVSIEFLGAVAHRLIAGFRSSEREELLHSLAFVDKLTGLPNRGTFESTLRQRLSGLPTGEAGGAVLIIDVDRFKQVNDTFGNATGDRLLVEFRRRIQVHLNEQDVAARVGGDEFALFLANAPSPRHTAQVARKIIQSLSRCVNIDGSRIYAGASVGIAQVPGDGQDAADLLKKAEIAMYRAKAERRSRLVFYASRMSVDSKRRSRLDLELRRALQRNELVLHYEPRFTLGNGALYGVEVLLCWQHPERGLLLPGNFVEDAQAIGLIPQIGNWVLKEACQQHRRWREAGLVIPQIAVKVFRGQLPRSGFVPMVRQATSEAGMPPGALEIDVSGALLAESDQRALLALQQLAVDGVPLALEDFGTGDATIRSLKSKPTQNLKIDLKSIEDPASADDTVRILHAIIELAHALGKTVIAAGIERPEQLLLLKTLGCDRGQGPLLGMAATAQDIERAFLKHPTKRSVAGARAQADERSRLPTSAPAPRAAGKEPVPAACTNAAAVPIEDEELLGALLTVPMYMAEDYPTVSSV